MLGSVLVTAILKTQDLNGTNSTAFDYQSMCGANNCPDFKLPVSSTDPSDSSVYWLLGSLIALCVVAILTTTFFMDNLKSITYTKNADDMPSEEVEIKEKITFKRMRKLLSVVM